MELVLDCGANCVQQQDELWRLHRALGREATRLKRLRVGGDDATLPGETVTVWQSVPSWSIAHSVWLFDLWEGQHSRLLKKRQPPRFLMTSGIYSK